MFFIKKFRTSLRLRILLALIAVAGAGIFLTYSAAERVVVRLTAEESGARIFSSLKGSAAAIDSEISYGLERARLAAAQPALRELLYRRNRGRAAQSDEETLRLYLKDAARTTRGLASITLVDAKGALAGAFREPGLKVVSPEAAGISVSPDEDYLSPPLIKKGDLFYEVAVVVPSSAPGAGAQAGTLRCCFVVPAVLRGGVSDFSLAGRRGKNLVITSKSKPREEVALDSESAALFRPALHGEEGYSLPRGKDGGLIYVYGRLRAADWLIAAQISAPTAPLLYTTAILERIRLCAWLCFALVSMVAFFISKSLAAPVIEDARSASVLLQECRAPGAEAAGGRTETELIQSALTEAGALIRQSTEHGHQLQSETDKLREEETELKYQNLELDKLNKYLLKRETNISELKKEINDLRKEISSGDTD
jgi:hypothetical protein